MLHSANTPVIYVADDGRTAKYLAFDFGLYTTGKPDGDCDAYFTSGNVYCDLSAESVESFLPSAPTCTLLNKTTPDANLAIIIPEIPEGKIVYLKVLNHAPIFIPVGVATAYADKCKALFVKERYNDDFRCCVTHTDEYKVGDLVKNPYTPGLS